MIGDTDPTRTACPKCGRTDRIDVLALVCVRLTADGGGAPTLLDGRLIPARWDNESPACCQYNDCGWCGAVGELKEPS